MAVSRLLACTLAALMLLPAHAAHADSARTIIVMDGSGSMWGQIEGVPKLEIARITLRDVLAGVSPELELGLMAYGHRTRGDCSDIEMLVPPAATTADAITAAADAMRFQGRTPLTDAVRRAAEELAYTENPATVILITDGIETCDADPCALANALDEAGIDFTAHVVGFGLSREEGREVACLAENTGGRFMLAGDAEALGAALAAAIGEAPAPLEAALDLSEPEPTRHFPGAEFMPGIGLAPSGQSFGEIPPTPLSFDFPEDGTAEQCRALCEADGLCGSWRYEPPGSYFVAEARCAVFTPQTEFVINAYPLEEGWASGMKPGVVGLERPYVPIGAEDIAASLRVPEPVVPGGEFTVLWSGPAGDSDWVDLVPVGYEEFSGELSYFYVNDTMEASGRPEGAGVLTAPAEPGLYELRYVFGRELDRHVALRVPMTVGGDSPGTGEAEPAPAQAAPRPIEAVFEADTDGYALAVSWSATPAPGQDLPPEAWAVPESVIGPVTGLFLPGTYDVLGDAGDSVFAGRVEITAEGPNEFTIPHSAALSPAGENQPGGYVCEGPNDCLIEDGTGLSFLLPAGWRTDEVFVAETAGGVRADYPTVTLYSTDGASILALNPLRRLEGNGPCTPSPAGELCIFGEPVGNTLAAFAAILPSLAYTPAAAGSPDLGGIPFTPADGSDPLAALVPGWSGQ